MRPKKSQFALLPAFLVLGHFLGAFSFQLRLSLCLLMGIIWLRVPALGAKSWIVHGGEARSLIVVDDGAVGLYRQAVVELQRYIGKLTGVQLKIVTPDGIPSIPKDYTLLLVGGPEANSLVRKAASKGLIDFHDLSSEGYILKTLSVEGRPTLVIGSNDEAGTLYGVYEWLERQGIVFQLSRDVLPEDRRTIVLENLDVRAETPFRRRGYGIASCFEHRAIWSYSDLIKFIDQMVKLKFNFLVWHMFPEEPFLKESFRGETKQMGDMAFWEGGYTLPQYNFGSHKTEDMVIGRSVFERFGKKYMAPDEWQGIQDQDQVYLAAQNMLRRVIQYAKTKNIKVWVALESLNSLSPNLARYCRRAGRPLPFSSYMGTYVCPTDPVVHEINEQRLKFLIESYPEAEGFFMWIPEGAPLCEHPEDTALFEQARPKYRGLEELMQPFVPWGWKSVDDAIKSNIGSVYLIEKILEVRNRISPKTKIGVGGWGRAYLLRALDRILPKDVPFIDNESSGVWTPKGVPMEAFGGMGQRERIALHVLDDDSGMVGLQFHVRLYDRDRLLLGSRENGVTGLTTWLHRMQGTEWLSRYVSEGAWNINSTPEQFYRDYARKVFGDQAQEPMFRAFMALEEKEGYKGYHYNKPLNIKDAPCCGPPEELTIAKRYAEQPNPYNGPVFGGWKKFVEKIPAKVELFSHEIELLEEALGHMTRARTVVAQQGKYQLDYLESKTEAYILHLRTFVELLQGYDALNKAFEMDGLTQREEFVHRLDECFQKFLQAQRLARYSAEKWAERVDDVPDLGVLYRMNTFMVTGTELVAGFMENIVNFHHGKPYLKYVNWGKVFSPLPIMDVSPELF